MPTHTPASIPGVKPMNQASRQFWLVPVLPASGRPRFAPVPVPEVITPFIMPTMRVANRVS